MNIHTKNISVVAVLVTIGIIAGYIESFFNFIPISGVKMGLSNIVLLYCVYKCSFTETMVVISLKSILNGILFSGMMSILYSLTAGIISACAMWLLVKYVDKISIYGISMCGSCIFNIVQFVVASIVFGNFIIMVNLWYVLPMSLVTGLVMGEIFRITFKGN